MFIHLYHTHGTGGQNVSRAIWNFRITGCTYAQGRGRLEGGGVWRLYRHTYEGKRGKEVRVCRKRGEEKETQREIWIGTVYVKDFVLRYVSMYILSIYRILYIHPCNCLSIHLSVYMMCISVNQYVTLSVCVYINMHSRPSIYPLTSTHIICIRAYVGKRSDCIPLSTHFSS